jgi:hypothetical protein
MPAMVGWVRLLVAGRKSRRWSVRGGVPTLERGNDQNPRIDTILISPIPPADR